VRRDNVEHLVMIGGPSDVVVEANIVRAVPALREPAIPRAPAPAETLSRAIPLPEAASNGSWPLQPEPPAPAPPMPPAMPPRRAPRIEPIPEEQTIAPPPHPEPPPRPQREVLSALADDLAAHAPPVAPVTPVTQLPPRNRAPAPPRLQPAEARAEPPRMPAAQPAAEPAAVDQSLAEMAQRLESALRKPKAVEARAPMAPAPEPEAEVEEAAAAAPPPPPQPSRPARSAEAKPARAEPKVKEGKALYDSLEQEMASLLGRPASKN
jgi:flagellar protein FliO/FliZ